MTKKRLFRILGILLLLGIFAGYFAFSTFLFKPFESDFEYDVAGLIPRDIDFFVAKAGLEDDFDEFPRLAVMDEIERTELWGTLSDSPEWGDLRSQIGLDDALMAEIDSQLEQIPLGLQPYDIFGGRDLAIAGLFKGAELVQSDWAVYGRVNWAGKLAVAMLSYPGLIGLESSGMTVVEEGDHYLLSGGDLDFPLYVTRIQDVVCIAKSQYFIDEAHSLAVKAGEGSFLQSAAYYDHIQSVDRAADRDEFEVMFDMRALFENLGLDGPWPDTKSEEFTPAFIGRLIQAPSCKKVLGVVGFDEGMSLDLYGGFSSEQISDAQSRIYRTNGFDRSNLVGDVALMAPMDSVLFVYLHGPVGDLLRQVFASVEPALRTNLEDAFRSTGQYNSLDELIDELDGALHNRLAFIVRKNDYPRDMKDDPETGQRVYNGPPNDGAPVYAMALVTWVRDEETIANIRDLVGLNPQKFGLQGRDDTETGYWKNKLSGYEVREFWSPFVPGTGMIATINTDKHFVISNNHRMLDHVIIKTYTQGGRQYPRLTDRTDFMGLVDSSLPSANMLVWFNPREGSETLRAQAQRWAEDNVGNTINWQRLRAEEEAKVIPQLFPGRTKGDLSEDEIRQLDSLVDPELSRYRDKHYAEQVPQLMQKKQREVDYLEGLAGLLAMLKLDPKSFELSVRAMTPFEPAGAQ